MAAATLKTKRNSDFESHLIHQSNKVSSFLFYISILVTLHFSTNINSFERFTSQVIQSEIRLGLELSNARL